MHCSSTGERAGGAEEQDRCETRDGLGIMTGESLPSPSPPLPLQATKGGPFHNLSQGMRRYVEDECRKLHQWSADNVDQLVRREEGEGEGKEREGRGREGEGRADKSVRWHVCLAP